MMEPPNRVPNPIARPKASPQIRCPLTLKRLEQIQVLSDEHIIHEAIGGPRWYSVRADKDANSRFGNGPDSRFLNSDIIKLWRIRNGIFGKSDKNLSLRMNGTVKDQDQKVVVTFRNGSTDVDYAPRFRRSEDGRRGRMIVPADRADEELMRVTNDFGKKGIRLTVTDRSSLGTPQLDIPFEVESAPIWAGALKIGYLAAFDFLGDSFLDDPLNLAWRQAIEAEKMDALTSSPIQFQLRVGTEPCPLTAVEHFIHITNATPKGRSVVVHLFGSPFTVTALLSQNPKLGVPECLGRVIHCNAKTSHIHGLDGPSPLIPGLPNSVD
jgi:hypothetical protein